MITRTLVRKDSTGKIRFLVYAVEPGILHQFNGIYNESVKPKFETFEEVESLKLNNSSVIHHERPVEGKNIGKSNETSPMEQATSECASKFKEKIRLGYVPFTEELDLNSLEVSLTTSTGVPLAMKAPTKLYSIGSNKNKFPKIIQKKLDGFRCFLIITYNNEEIDVQLSSKTGKSYSLPHITDFVAKAINSFIESKDNIDTIILDGELYAHGHTLEEISTLVKKPTKESLKLKLMVYDVPLEGVRQEDRLGEAQGIVNEFHYHSDKAEDYPVEFLEYEIVEGDGEVQTLHDEYVSEGYEGAMIKDPDGYYVFGQRSSYWAKVKVFDEDEFEIVGLETGSRGAQDLKFIVKLPNGGTCAVTSSGNTAYKERILKEQPIGKMLTVKYFSFTKYGSLRNATSKTIRDYE